MNDRTLVNSIDRLKNNKQLIDGNFSNAFNFYQSFEKRSNIKTFEKLSISEKDMEQYNTEYCMQVNFTRETLKQLKKQYRQVKCLPGFLHNTLKGRSTPDRDLILENKNLYAWSSDLSAFITPNIPKMNENWLSLKENPFTQKNEANGLMLVAWWIDSRLLSTYGLSKENNFQDMNVFREFLLKSNVSKNTASNYKYFERTNSQESIEKIEFSQDLPYLATILDLKPDHVPLLNNLKETSQKHLINSYGVDLNKDFVEMFFHFPYPEMNTTLHLHIRVNHDMHPLERNHAFDLDEVINYLNNNQEISDLILGRRSFCIGRSTSAFLQKVEGISLTEIKNPFILNTNLAMKY